MASNGPIVPLIVTVTVVASNWHSNTKVLGEKPASMQLLSIANCPWTIPGMSPGLHNKKQTTASVMA